MGLDADTKLVASWYVGQRDSEAATTFIDDLAPARLAPRVQLTSDGHKPYLEAIEGAFVMSERRDGMIRQRVVFA